MIVSELGYSEIAKLLLEQNGIDINARDTNTGETALLKASRNCHNDIVKLLLEQKEIDVNIKDNNEKTILNETGLMNKKEIIDLIARRKQNSEMMMNSGNRRDIFIPGHCTFEQTGYTMVNHNRYYRCRTCMNNSGINFCFCEECAKVCHKGHDVTQSGSGPAFCDCGAGHFLFPCMLMHRHNEEKEKKDETEKA